MHLRVSIIDMNNGLENQAMRAFGEIVTDFINRVRVSNPELNVSLQTASPRDKGEFPDRADLYLSTGGPGSPYDGVEWEGRYFELLNDISNDNSRFLFAVCHSYQLAARWAGAGTVQLRSQGKKFGIMPIYVTQIGTKSELLGDFGDRLFAFEHRDWEVVGVDENKWKILARESRDGFSKGAATLAIDFGNGIEGVQFHPEADPVGIRAWICREDKKQELINVYGEELWQSMIKTVDREDRVIRTRKKIIPDWLNRKFNILAEKNGWKKI